MTTEPEPDTDDDPAADEQCDNDQDDEPTGVVTTRRNIAPILLPPRVLRGR